MDAPATAPAKPSRLKRWVIGIFIALVIVAAIYFTMVYLHKKSVEKIRSFIEKEAAKYGTRKDEVVKLITDTAGEIISERQMKKLAKSNAATMGISYEQAVVDLAVGQLRSMKYID